MNEDISRLQEAICRLTGCTSKYVETTAVTECFHGFQGEVLWQRDVAVFEIEGHTKAARVYAWATRNDGDENDRHVIVLEIPPVNSPRTAIAAAMAASIVNGSFELF
ncbi:MAG TPA: hypothetical protein VJ784_19290 [Pyrinomonadaceae bacterium]|nr:hypothetical protein [Pyrinomonadaceae bacterium]